MDTTEPPRNNSRHDDSKKRPVTKTGTLPRRVSSGPVRLPDWHLLLAERASVYPGSARGDSGAADQPFFVRQQSDSPGGMDHRDLAGHRCNGDFLQGPIAEELPGR